jgi:glycosyltransferase involved in cell wall biosynthesis
MMADAEILLAGAGATTDVRAQSGRPYFLLESAKELKVQSWTALDLDVEGLVWAARRYAWNLSSLLAGRGTGGYQYTEAFLERLWKPVQPLLAGRHILSWSVLYPPSVVANEKVVRSFYIDQSLGQAFSGYGIRASIRSDVADSALHRERIGYSRAHAIIATSEWARRGVLATFSDAPERVHVVLLGANLPIVPYRRWAAMHRPRLSDPDRPLRLLFIGLHPLRKGLDRLLRAMVLARQGGSNVELTVVGAQPEQLDADARSVSGVRWIGRVDKITGIERLLNLAGEHDLGCLLSRAEAGGISLREFQAMGLGVLAPNVGGSPELVLPGAGELIGPEASDEAIAAVLISLERDRSRVDAMRAAAWNSREDVLWPPAANRISKILAAPRGQAPYNESA